MSREADFAANALSAALSYLAEGTAIRCMLSALNMADSLVPFIRYGTDLVLRSYSEHVRVFLHYCAMFTAARCNFLFVRMRKNVSSDVCFAPLKLEHIEAVKEDVLCDQSCMLSQ